MEETLNKILLELQQLNKEQQELIEGQKELIGRIETIEKGHKKLMTTYTKNLNKICDEFKIGQHHLKVRIETLKKKKDFGQNELKELIMQSTAYMSGKLSVSERMKLEIEWLNESERHELVHKINEKNLTINGNKWSRDWDDDY